MKHGFERLQGLARTANELADRYVALLLVDFMVDQRQLCP